MQLNPQSCMNFQPVSILYGNPTVPTLLCTPPCTFIAAGEKRATVVLVRVEE